MHRGQIGRPRLPPLPRQDDIQRHETVRRPDDKVGRLGADESQRRGRPSGEPHQEHARGVRVSAEGVQLRPRPHPGEQGHADDADGRHSVAAEAEGEAERRRAGHEVYLLRVQRGGHSGVRLLAEVRCQRAYERLVIQLGSG